MRHKQQITLLLVAALLVSWAVTSSTSFSRQPRNDGTVNVASLTIEPVTPLMGTTIAPAPLSSDRRRNTQINIQAQTDYKVPADLQPYSDALLPAYKSDISLVKDATRYDVDITIDADLQHVRGMERVLYRNRAANSLHEIMLRLYPNTEYLGGSMRIDNVMVNGIPRRPAVYYRTIAGILVTETHLLTDTSVLSIPLALPLEPGQILSLSMDYVITVPVQSNSGYRTFGWADHVLALPDVYAMIPVYDHLGWHVDPAPDYGDIVYAEASLYHVTITAPANLVIVATGVCTQLPFDPHLVAPSEVLPHQLTTTCSAGPVRDFAIHASGEYHVLSNLISGAGGDVLVSSYYLPGHQVAAEHVLDYAGTALLFYESRFGVYPYKELKVFPSATNAGGIEYPMLAGVLDTLYGADLVYLEWIVAHEVAHQWWYGIIGSDQINEPWLDESLAQYSTLFYMEHRYGPDFAAVQKELRLTGRYHGELNIGKDSVVDQPTIAFDRALYFPIVYGKGPLFFDEVRRYIGEAQFTTWLHTYFEQHRFGIVHREDLLAVADDMSMGVLVRQAFAKWMHGLNIR